MSQQIFNCTVTLKHAVPFDSHEHIVIWKLGSLDAVSRVSCANLLGVHIIRAGLFIHILFCFHIGFSVEIYGEIVLLFWYEGFYLWWCSAFHVGWLHLTLCTGYLRNFVVRVRLIAFQTHRKVVALLFVGGPRHVFATALTLESGCSCGHVGALALSGADPTSWLLSWRRACICIWTSLPSRLVSDGSYIARATAAATEGLFAETRLRTRLCHSWIACLAWAHSDALCWWLQQVTIHRKHLELVFFISYGSLSLNV